MTQNAFTFLTAFIAQIFRLFTSWYLPGTNVTPAGLLFFFLAGALSIKFIKAIFLSDFSDGGSNEK